jgi:hypothetical protein
VRTHHAKEPQIAPFGGFAQRDDGASVILGDRAVAEDGDVHLFAPELTTLSIGVRVYR